ncbi:MAG: DUF4145 domain-containing protein [Bryobacteraceae bacterium]
MSRDTVESFCPRCNCVVAAEIRATASGSPTADLFDSLPDGEDGLRTVRYSVAFCGKCEGVFLYRDCNTEPSELPLREVLYPRSTEPLADDIPVPIRRPHESATSCFETANYEPCVIMCRKTLEAMCQALGESRGTLQARLQRLRDAGIVEARLCDWADELRFVGNDAAHDLSFNVTKEDARDCLEFVDAILVYVFTLDKKFREFKNRRRAVGGP